ncbi:MAG TPA: NAD(P)H-hydrate dehydratase [Candidatus Sulfomarinibacteraceae bacterium]|nr:NAD(P)H-hydrate dehydratase [Candidatus Sulfomarinibacteraceae bacterium]
MTIKVFTVAEMVAAEKAADASGVSYAQMMEKAGHAVALALAERYPVQGKQVLVLVGPGNNGGDGLVAGRYLAQMGAEVSFYLYRERDPQADENFARILEMTLFQAHAGGDQRYRVLRQRLRNADVVIDALLGTGVDRPIGGELATMMRQVQAGLQERELATSPDELPALTSTTAVEAGARGGERPYVVAVDCPSGLNTDTGELDPLAIPADLTVTFAGPKRGHFIFPGAAALGELVVADIDISEELPEVQAVPVALVTADAARALLPQRPRSGHKGTFGKVLIAAGSEHYWGAPLLCGRGAYRAGAGLVALAVPGVVRPVVSGQLPEATYPPVPDEDNFTAEGARFLLEQIAGHDALLLGPGLGPAKAFVQALLEKSQSLPPLVVDADGLNVLAEMDGWWQQLPANSVLTPHPGEMARLAGMGLGDIKEQDRVALAREKAAAWNQVVLLKGAFTVVAAPDGRCRLLPFANPLLSAAGSGDVLSGVIVALSGQGLDPFDAAVLGAYLHAAAGELARAEWGDAGLLSGEIADWVPEVRMRLA